MLKKIGVIFVLGLIFIKVDSQQVFQVGKYLPLHFVNIKNAFFNREVINPSLSNDTILFNASIISQQQFVGTPDAPNYFDLILNGHLPNSKSTFGLDLGLLKDNSFNNELLRLNYTYKIILSEKSDFKTGINLGMSRFKFDESANWFFRDPSQPNQYNWNYFPITGIGITYRRLNQNIGISYINVIQNSWRLYSTQYYIFQNYLVVNYSSSYNLTNSLKTIPEIIAYSDSHNVSIMLKEIISYQDRLFTGIIFNNSIKKYGIMISGIIFKYFEIGYIFDMDNSLTNQNKYFTHNLQLGILIK